MKLFFFLFISFSIFADDCRKNFHLTFDDGPSIEHTRDIMNTLRAESAPATFFLNADKVNDPTIVTTNIILDAGIYERSDGRVIGVYNTDYLNSLRVSRRQIMQEITSSRLFKVGGHGFGHYSFMSHDPTHPGSSLNNDQEKLQNLYFTYDIMTSYMSLPKAFRLPFGKPFPSQERDDVEILIGRAGFDLNVGWDYDSRDFENSSESHFIERVVDGACAAGGVMLFHDTKQITKSTIGRIVKRMKRRGANFVSLDDILAHTDSITDLRGSARDFETMDELLESLDEGNRTCSNREVENWTHVGSYAQQSSINNIMSSFYVDGVQYRNCCTYPIRNGLRRIYCN